MMGPYVCLYKKVKTQNFGAINKEQTKVKNFLLIVLISYFTEKLSIKNLLTVLSRDGKIL